MRSSRLWLITAVALGVMLNPLNTTTISVAFSRLQEEFHVGYSSIAWLIATYYVASAVTQPVMGKIGDLFGRKRVIILGLAMITVASLLAPLSPSIEWLMAFRAIQAVAYSIMLSIPSYLQQVRHFDAKTVGTIMLSVAVFGIFVTPLVGRWIDRSSSKLPLIAGTLILTAGTLLMLLIHDDTAPYMIFAILSVFGISSGFHNLGLQTALYTYVSKAETGVASGLFMTSRFMGTILSSSLLGAIFSHDITTQRLHILAWACAAMSVAIFVLVVGMPSSQHHMKNTGVTD
jgi:MFS family permease